MASREQSTPTFAPKHFAAEDVSDDRTAALVAALGGGAAIVVNAALLVALRRGLPGEPWLVALTIAYAALIVGTATSIELRVADARRRALAQVMALVGFLVLPIVAFGAVHWLLALLVALAAWIVRARRTKLRMQPMLLGSLGAALGAVIALALFGLAGFQHRELQAHFLLPEHAGLGLLHKDPFLFVSFAAEIMNGRWPGAALDGIRPLFYHFGVPLFLASFARSTESSPFAAYMAGQQLLFVPLIVFYAGLATASLATIARAPTGAGTIAVALAVAGVLTVPHFTWSIVYYNEASAASAPLALLMLPLAAAWLCGDGRDDRAGTVAHSVCLVAVLLAAALFKLSTAVTVGAWAGYLVLRGRLSERASNLVVMIALLIGLGLAAVLWPLLFGRPFVPGHADARTVTQVLEEAAWALACLMLALALQRACGALGCELPSTNTVLRGLIVMVPFTAAGAWLIGAVYHIYNSRYLFNNFTLLALPLVALNAAALIDAAALRLAPLRRAAALPALGLMIVFLAAFGLEAGRAAPTHAMPSLDAALQALCARAVPGKPCGAFRRVPPHVSAAFGHATGPRMLALLRDAPQADAVFVPPENEAYWRFVLSGQRPTENLNFLPAHLGVPLLLGLPPAGYAVDVTAVNLALMGGYDEASRARAMTEDELCRHARARDIARIVVFASLDPPDARLLECR